MSEEEDFRSLLDERGLLRAGALHAPSRSDAFTVFAQRSDARIELSAWVQHAKRFFAADLGLSVEKRYRDRAPHIDAARVVLSSTLDQGTRLCFARPATSDDRAAALEAERACGAGGLADLAKRCSVVWLVAAASDDDRVSLTIAAILASVVLGPILPPSGGALYGVRGARIRLEPRAP